MQRRNFLKNSLLAGASSLFIPSIAKAQATEAFARKKAKNIIFLVSDDIIICEPIRRKNIINEIFKSFVSIKY